MAEFLAGTGFGRRRHTFIDPSILARIGNLPLVARAVVEGFVSGMHRSPYHGFSLDFAEYRAYSPGDDIRSVDWKVYARSDRFFVKKFEGDTNTQLYLMLDSSASMGFSSGSVTKHDYGRFLAASLAYLSRRQKDAFGLLTFDQGIVKFTPPRTRFGHYNLVLQHLEGSRTGSGTDITGAMMQLAELTRRRSLVVLISDFYESPEKLSKALRYFHHRGHDVIAFHILDPAELELPYEGVQTLEDMESGEIQTFSAEAREAYRSRLEEHQRDLKRKCADLRIDYEVLRTDQPLDRALYRYLSARSRKY